MKSGVSRAEANKAIRQEALREQLSNKGLVQNVLENSNKIQDLQDELSAHDVNRLKIASELQLKLVAKYLPDVKQVELQPNMNVSGEMKHELVRAEVINAASTAS